MARPKRLRRLSFAPPVHSFLPAGPRGRVKRNEKVVITMDELEALRLADLECDSQEMAAKKMRISRATFGRIVEAARSKVARALVLGNCIEISGGTFVYGGGGQLRCPRCRCRQRRDNKERAKIICRRCCQPLQNREEAHHLAGH